MKAFLIFVVGLVVGGAAGLFGGGALGTGVGAGVGIVTGFHSGACLTMEAAREQGLITAEQEPELWAAALEQLGSDNAPEGTAVERAELDCAKVVADLKSASAD